MNGHEKRSLKKREQILEAAKALFFRQGIAGVTIEQIAEMAHVSRVTIFKYFNDKEGLVREAVRSFALDLLAGLQSLVERECPFREKLVEAFSVFERIRDESINKEIRADKELLNCVREVMKAEGLPMIQALIGQGKLAGEIDPALDDKAILLYFSAFQPIISNPDYIREARSVQDSLFTMFMGGLLQSRRDGNFW